jgi:hypothetical protein
MQAPFSFLSMHVRFLGDDGSVVAAKTSVFEAHPARSENEQHETTKRIFMSVPRDLVSFMQIGSISGPHGSEMLDGLNLR